MKIIRETVIRKTKYFLLEFLNEYNLDLKITKYVINGDISFNVYFTHHGSPAEVISGEILIGESGRGKTEVEAVNDYIKNINNKPIVFHSYNLNNRLEINVPTIILPITDLSDIEDNK